MHGSVGSSAPSAVPAPLLNIPDMPTAAAQTGYMVRLTKVGPGTKEVLELPRANQVCSAGSAADMALPSLGLH